MEKKLVSYQQFLVGYKSGEILVLVNKSKAGDFVMSEFGDKHNKRAHQFWTWTGLVILIPLPITLFIFQGWLYAIGSFILGLIVSSAARKSSEKFVLENMLGSEDFWDYVLMHGGAKMQDVQGNEIVSEFLNKMKNKIQ